jgi:hypothetical protein
MWPVILAGLLFFACPPIGFGEETNGTRPLLTVHRNGLAAALPSDAHLLDEPRSLEQFLEALDEAPPDWAAVYGHGHHDSGHDERLFDLNRERDAKRQGKAALQRPITFLWHGELSAYDPRDGGFRVAVGPKLTPTRWGIVRFKPEDLPGNLTAIPNPSRREALRRQFEKGAKIEIAVALTGKLIPDESIVYDFSHDQEGQGLIMPVVRVERIDYFIVRQDR